MKHSEEGCCIKSLGCQNKIPQPECTAQLGGRQEGEERNSYTYTTSWKITVIKEVSQVFGGQEPEIQVCPGPAIFTTPFSLLGSRLEFTKNEEHGSGNQKNQQVERHQT